MNQLHISQQPEKTLLSMQKIGKTYSTTRVLGEVDFDLKAGEVHALVGENGAGKTTLLNILSGVIKADEGSFHVDQQQVEFDNPNEAQKGGIGTVFQELSLVPGLSIAENIFPNRAPRNRWHLIDWPALEKKTTELLTELELAELNPNELVGRLPGSTQQLIEIAKAISLNNQILLLDEPTSALTPIANELKSNGTVRFYEQNH